MDNKFGQDEISVVVSEDKACQRTISVEITPARFSDEKAKVLKQMAKEVSLPGFRRGKVPIDVVERRFADEIKAEAIRKILPQAFQYVIAEKQLEPIGEPEFRDVAAEDDKPLSFTMCLEVYPRIELQNYHGMKLEPDEISVTDGEVEEVLKSLQERSADYVKVDRASAAGDVVMLSFAPVAKDGKANEKQRVPNYPVMIGAGEILPAFEQAVTGKVAGETGRVEVEYPADYKPERLAGKKIVYDYVVNEVREKRVPAVSDELAAKVDSRFKTLVELREDIRKRLFEEKEREERRHMEERAIDLIIERNPFEVPQSMRERFKEELRREDERRREAAGVGPETDEEKRKQIEELFDRIALRNIKRHFLMDRIAEMEGLAVSDADLDAELQKIAAINGRPVEDVKRYVRQDNDRLSSLKNRIRERKIFEIIIGPAEAPAARQADSPAAP